MEQEIQNQVSILIGKKWGQDQIELKNRGVK